MILFVPSISFVQMKTQSLQFLHITVITESFTFYLAKRNTLPLQHVASYSHTFITISVQQLFLLNKGLKQTGRSLPRKPVTKTLSFNHCYSNSLCLQSYYIYPTAWLPKLSDLAWQQEISSPQHTQCNS